MDRRVLLCGLILFADAGCKDPNHLCKAGDGTHVLCDAHYFCADNGYCQEEALVGEPCAPNLRCDDDLLCGTNSLCYRPGAPGDPCSVLAPCLGEPVGGDSVCLLGNAGADLTQGVCSDPAVADGPCSWRLDGNGLFGQGFGCQVGQACHPLYVYFDPLASGPPPSEPICMSIDCGMPGTCAQPGAGLCADDAGCPAAGCVFIDPPCWYSSGSLACWQGPPTGTCVAPGVYQPDAPCDPALGLDPTQCLPGTKCGFQPSSGYDRVCTAEHTLGVGETCGSATDVADRYDSLCAFGLACTDPGPTCQPA